MELVKHFGRVVLAAGVFADHYAAYVNERLIGLTFNRVTIVIGVFCLYILRTGRGGIRVTQCADPSTTQP